MKCIDMRNLYTQYESPPLNNSRYIAQDNFSSKEFEIQGQKLWYQRKGCVTRNSYINYKRSISHHLNGMSKNEFRLMF